MIPQSGKKSTKKRTIPEVCENCLKKSTRRKTGFYGCFFPLGYRVRMINRKKQRSPDSLFLGYPFCAASYRVYQRLMKSFM